MEYDLYANIYNVNSRRKLRDNDQLLELVFDEFIH